MAEDGETPCGVALDNFIFVKLDSDWGGKLELLDEKWGLLENRFSRKLGQINVGGTLGQIEEKAIDSVQWHGFGSAGRCGEQEK